MPLRCHPARGRRISTRQACLGSCETLHKTRLASFGSSSFTHCLYRISHDFYYFRSRSVVNKVHPKVGRPKPYRPHRPCVVKTENCLYIVLSRVSTHSRAGAHPSILTVLWFFKSPVSPPTTQNFAWRLGSSQFELTYTVAQR